MKKYLKNYSHFKNSCKKYLGDYPEYIFSYKQLENIKLDFNIQDFQLKTVQVSNPYLSLDEICIFCQIKIKENNNWRPIK